MKYQILEMMFKNEKPKSVFEVGVASGGLLLDIKENIEGIERFGGCDVTRDLEESKERFPEHKENFIYHDIIKPWPLEDKSYDIVFCVGVLIYIVNPIPAVREMLRVGKTVIIAEPHREESDDIGHILRVDMTNDKSHHAIVRNYRAFFQHFKIIYTMQDSGLGKHIFKIK